MRTTKQLSKALALIQDEAIERIKSFFKGKSYVRIIVPHSAFLQFDHNRRAMQVTEILEGSVHMDEIGGKNPKHFALFGDLSADALLTILDELERMKKGNQLKKP